MSNVRVLEGWLCDRVECIAAVAAWACVLSLAVAGCAPEIEQEPQTEPRVSSMFDSETGVIPLPNNAALESDGTLPLQDGADADTAQGDFLSYLDTLHGWLRITPLEIPFDGELDSSTVTEEHVQLYRLPEDAEPVEMEIDSVSVRSATHQRVAQGGGTETVEGSMVRITPAEPIERDTAYGYVVTDGITDTQGRPVVPSQPMFFAASTEPLVNEDGERLIESIPSDAQAQQLEQLRQMLQPMFELATASGVERDSVVAASMWTTFEDTMAEFDPNAGNIPFPNDFLRNQMTGQVQLPVPSGADPLQQGILDELNTRTGFSTVAPGWIDFAGPINTETLGADSFVGLERTQQIPEVYGPEQFNTQYFAETNHLIFEPTVPLASDSTLAPVQESPPVNIWAVTDALESPENGWSVKPSPITVLLRSPHSLVDNCEQTPNDGGAYMGCESTVSAISAAQAQQLEVARSQYNALLSALGLISGLPDGLTRNNIIAAWFAHPSYPTQDAQTWRARGLDTVEESPEASFASGSNCSGGSSGQCEVDPSGLENVQIAQGAAEFETVLYLQPDGTLSDENSSRTSVGLSVFVPAQTGDCSSVGEFPVAILQHGLTSWRRSMRQVADVLAGACVATVAMDFVGHGGRTSGAGSLHPETIPEGSGANFLSTELVRTKNHFLQSFVDLSVLAEYIVTDGIEGAIDDDSGTEYFAYDGDDSEDPPVGYVGQSLGGILGASFVTIDDEVTVAVFNAAGGKLSRILSEGEFGQPIRNALMNAGINEGTFEEARVLSFIQWIAESGDPMAFAPFMVENPVDELQIADGGGVEKGDDLPENEPLIQMAAGDAVVPNGATEALARSIGESVSLDETTFDASHSFLTVPEDPSAGSATDCARRQIAAWVSSGLGVDGSTEATLPSDLSVENCVSQ